MVLYPWPDAGCSTTGKKGTCGRRSLAGAALDNIRQHLNEIPLEPRRVENIIRADDFYVSGCRQRPTISRPVAATSRPKPGALISSCERLTPRPSAEQHRTPLRNRWAHPRAKKL